MEASAKPLSTDRTLTNGAIPDDEENVSSFVPAVAHRSAPEKIPGEEEVQQAADPEPLRRASTAEDGGDEKEEDRQARNRTRITFDVAADTHPKNDATLYIPGPRDRDRGYPLIELNKGLSMSHDGTWNLSFSRATTNMERPRI